MIVIVNANDHCRLMEKMPSMKIRRNSVTEFMKKYNIAIPEPMPVEKQMLGSNISLIKLPKLQSVQLSGYHLITVC